MDLKKIVSGITSLALSLTAFTGISYVKSPSQLNAAAATANWKFDFGGNGAASGYTGVSASDGYSASKGYGFSGSVSNVTAGGSGALSDAVSFTGGSFTVDLPKGLYQVTVTTGNVSRTTIMIEGMPQMMNLTGNNAVESIQVPITDGQLNLQAVAGRANTQFSVSAVEITQLNDTGVTNPTIWICGDSTVANYYNTADTSQHGWGQFFGDHVGTQFQIRNQATSGQYAKGFVDAGQFKPIEAYGKAGDKYIISIGINDTNYSNADEYYTVVTDMVKRAKAKGMEVILVKQQGRHGDLIRTNSAGSYVLLSGRWFGGQLDQIGQEQNVEVIDLFKAWQDFGLSLGSTNQAAYDAMTEYYAAGDDLHQSKKGAQKIAELMAGLTGLGREPVTMDTSKAYRFKNVNSGLYLEVKNAEAAAGANVQQWNGDTLGDWNIWRLKHKGYNYYEVWSYLDGGSTYLLDVTNGSKENGANIAINTNSNSGAQWFRFFRNSDGSYTLISRCSGDSGAVEVGSALMNEGANVQQWVENGHNCQKWILEEVEWPVQSTTTTTTTTTTSTTTTTTGTTVTTAPRIKKYPGNANCDNEVNMADAVLIMQALSNPDIYGQGKPDGITDDGVANADVYGDGDGMTILDAQYIQSYKLGLNDIPPIEYYPPETETTTTTTTTAPFAGYYFAVDQTWENGVTEEVHPGFTKTDASYGSTSNIGYVNLDNMVGSNITFNVNADKAGNYMTHIRFANGTDIDRKMNIFVNGDTKNYWQQSFPGTGNWDTWQEHSVVLSLKAGANTIRFESVVEQGGPNLDYINIRITDEPVEAFYDPNSQPEIIDGSKPAIYLAGDSTCQYYNASKQSQNGGPIQGWGYYFQNYFADGINVSNRAVAGRSSKKFYDDGNFNSIVDSLKAGDFVIIQFAINDADYTHTDRYAPTCGNVDNPTDGSYEWYMTQFIKSTQAKGATPILMSCTLSAKSYSNGKFVASYTNYTDACKKLAAKYNCPFIDVNGAMVDHYNSIGYDKAITYHMASVVAGSTDLTHFNESGANTIAGLIASKVKSANIAGLSQYVK